MDAAGKTERAHRIIDSETGRRQYASTFVSFYPADDPQYTVICVLFTKETHKSIYGSKFPAKVVEKFIENT